jgi:alcohol-forming fatty acyl-CoA reductase
LFLRFVKGYQKLTRLVDLTKFFAVRQWTYQNDNIVRLDHILKQQGIEGLEFDGRTIDWANGFYPHFIPGLKKYFFKESLENVEQLRTHYKR